MVRHSAADLTHQVLSETGTILWERALQLATRRMDITPLVLERASKFTRSGKGHARNVNAVRDWRLHRRARASCVKRCTQPDGRALGGRKLEDVP